MAYPSDLDSFPEIEGPDRLKNLVSSKRHSLNHTNLGVAVGALEAKVGVDDSAVPASLDYRITALEDGGGSLPTVITVNVLASFPVTRDGSSNVNSFVLNEEYPVAQTQVSVAGGVVTVQPGVWAVDGLMYMQAQTPPPGSALSLYPSAINTNVSSYPIEDGVGSAQTFVSAVFYTLVPTQLLFTYGGNLADLSFATVNLTKLR